MSGPSQLLRSGLLEFHPTIFSVFSLLVAAEILPEAFVFLLFAGGAGGRRN